MFNFCRSDVQLLQVGCSTFVGWMFNFRRLDVLLLQVGFSTFVGWMYNFCRSDVQLLQIRCSNFFGPMFNFCRSDPSKKKYTKIDPAEFPLRIPNLFWNRIVGGVLHNPSEHYQQISVSTLLEEFCCVLLEEFHRYTVEEFRRYTTRRVPLVHLQKY